jgi:putative two-component system response regulator
MKIVFVVDDNDTNLLAAKAALEGSYRVITMESASKMFKLATKLKPDLILLDVLMPEIDGFTALSMMKEDPILANVPVIFLTSKLDPETEIRGFELGAVDFLNKPFSVPILIRRIETHIETDKLIKMSEEKLRKIQNALISVIAELVEDRDKVTGGHIERTQIYLRILVEKMIEDGIYPEESKSWDTSILLPSAQLHDVGKISISDYVLNKPSKLSDEEFDIIKTHAAEGERIIEEIMKKTEDDGFLMHAKMFAGYHHEKWDGSGYPRGLSGMDIPLQGRLMAIADVYDALVSERPYKKAFTHEKAVEIIIGNSGTQFDPTLIDVFKQVSDEFWIENVAGSDSVD